MTYIVLSSKHQVTYKRNGRLIEESLYDGRNIYGNYYRTLYIDANKYYDLQKQYGYSKIYPLDDVIKTVQYDYEDEKNKTTRLLDYDCAGDKYPGLINFY